MPGGFQMLRFTKFQTLLIPGVVLLGALFALPNFLGEEIRDRLPPFFPRSTINAGLDLQGGSHLQLGVMTQKVIEDRMRNMTADIRRIMRTGGDRRIRFSGIDYEPGEKRISVTVADAGDVQEAAVRLRDLAQGGMVTLPGYGLRPYTVTVRDAVIDVVMTPEAAREFARQAVTDSIEVIRRRVDPAGNRGVSILAQGEDRIVVQVPGDRDPEALKAVINRTGQLSFHEHDPLADVQEAQAGFLPPGRILLPRARIEGEGVQPPLVLMEDPVITGDMVRTASAEPDPDGAGFQIGFSFDRRGSLRFAQFTRDHVGSVFAIVLDGEIIQSPVIRGPIPGGSGRITGNFSAAEASRAALLIRSGALPAELVTLEQRSVGADLGADSVRAGTFALIAGFLAVIVFMVLVYGRFGVYADLALIANLVLIAGLLSLFGTALTLPGIAGIVLTVGMAVDANVLVFERIREELRRDSAPVLAVGAGYEKARAAIFDANITTLAAAVIMFLLGAGPVRGFAITLMAGVVTSVFTAYWLTRLMVGRYLLSARPQTLKI